MILITAYGAGQKALFHGITSKVHIRNIEQHLDNLRRKDSLRGAETTEISVRLRHYSASHFEGSAIGVCPGIHLMGVFDQ